MRTSTAQTCALILTTFIVTMDGGGCVESATCEDLFTCNKVDASPADGGDASARGGTNHAGGSQGTGGALGVGGGSGRDASAEASLDARSDAPSDTLRDSNLDARAENDSSDAAFDGREAEPPSCNVNASPSVESCLVDDSYGVFVSPEGVDSNAGTKASPLATLDKAIPLAKSTNRRVFVCTRGNGAPDFGTPVVIDASVAGTRLFGGFSCTDWHYLGQGVNTRVKTAAGQIPLTLQSATATVIEDFSFEAADAEVDGGSSIAAFITNSSTVSLTRTALKAGRGKKGAPVTLAGTNYDLGSGTIHTARDGNQAADATGGAPQFCLCKDGTTTSTGGSGGNGAAASPAGTGEPGSSKPEPEVATGAAGEGETTVNGGCGNGKKGSSAPAAANGQGALKAGQLTAQGWNASYGMKGSTGVPGQGGGGGGGGVSVTGRGGGGGGACGGCGGLGGPGGGSGGSSFALLSYGSLVTLDSCTLEASLGGDGSPGAEGQAGQLGGGGGVPATSGCTGGSGGTGGQGGIGGGGAGGLSVGVGYHGTKPTYGGNTTISVPTEVAHGAGRGLDADGGVVADAGGGGTQGAEGQSSKELELD